LPLSIGGDRAGGNSEASDVTSHILLIRHAAHSHLGNVLSGRTPGIPLSEEGCSQAAALAERLRAEPLDLLHASPVQRAHETARAIAAQHPGLQVETTTALEELDFGDWAGRAFVELAEDPGWHSCNSERASAVAPNGETMSAAQARAWEHIERSAAAEPGKTIAMVSHCDIIRAVIARVLGLSLDHIFRFDIAPASISRLAVGAWGARVISVNEVFHG
jgi:broad specificity phosphatase PhoE